jgi:hypothetical protein
VKSRFQAENRTFGVVAQFCKCERLDGAADLSETERNGYHDLSTTDRIRAPL